MSHTPHKGKPKRFAMTVKGGGNSVRTPPKQSSRRAFRQDSRSGTPTERQHVRRPGAGSIHQLRPWGRRWQMSSGTKLDM